MSTKGNDANGMKMRGQINLHRHDSCRKKSITNNVLKEFPEEFTKGNEFELISHARYWMQVRRVKFKARKELLIAYNEKLYAAGCKFRRTVVIRNEKYIINNRRRDLKEMKEKNFKATEICNLGSFTDISQCFINFRLV